MINYDKLSPTIRVASKMAKENFPVGIHFYGFVTEEEKEYLQKNNFRLDCKAVQMESRYWRLQYLGEN